ncbi:MAG: dTMP kinase [Anaerolineae bacterium]
MFNKSATIVRRGYEVGKVKVLTVLTRSYLIVLEGLDGAGKTTISYLLTETLKNWLGSETVLGTFEPNYTFACGDYIKSVLQKRVEQASRPFALAFAANRADHLEREVEPFLSSGNKVVVCDRYYLSSLAYQTTQETPLEYVWSINKGSHIPDLTLFLDADTKICYERIKHRGLSLELFEGNLAEKRQIYEVAIRFLQTINNEKIVKIDANGAIQQVLENGFDRCAVKAVICDLSDDCSRKAQNGFSAYMQDLGELAL